jgi:nucleoside-diphosphate-sugar epimerase/protein involved in polysaccharide export with SLBB domain
MLHVQVFDTPELEQHARVTDSGDLPLMMGGNVHVKGMTPAQVARVVEETLQTQQLMRNPKVAITIEEFSTQKVSVFGEVKVPGAYPINTPRSVLDVLTLAGGLTELADRKVLIERCGTKEKVPYFVSNDSHAALDTAAQINPGDSLLVPKAGIVYVLGDVARPGGYTMTNNEAELTVLELVARAGGTNHSAVPSHAKLIHKNGNAYIEEGSLKGTTRPTTQLATNKDCGGNMAVKCALVCGAGGFIGGHMVTRLKREGCWVRGVDLKYAEFSNSAADDFVIGDLRDQGVCREIVDRRFDEVYQFAADMGGAGYIFTGEHDANVMHNSATINLNVVDTCYKRNIKRVFYSSSACMYPAHNQIDPDNPNCAESSAYPAAPDSEYGWEKLFSERVYLAYNRNCKMENRIARFHNIFGPEGTWAGGKEKAPAAMCRKVAEAKSGDTIQIWGDGKQTRSFLHIDECLEGVLRLTRSEHVGPFNIGSEEMVTINQLVEMVMDIAGKKLHIEHTPGPLGVRGRNSDNTLIRETLGWAPSHTLHEGLELTYAWIEQQVMNSRNSTTRVGDSVPFKIGVSESSRYACR